MTTIPPKGKCNKNSGVIGITSTPVIDIASGLLYVMSYTEESGMPVYRLHALDIATLADSVPPVVVAASQTLADGSSYQFQAAYSRQRPRAAALQRNNLRWIRQLLRCKPHG